MNKKNESCQIKTKVFAAIHRDEDVLVKSSSGGAFTAISDLFLAEGDAIACCSYNYEINKMEFNLIFDKESRDSARGSKYIQGTMNNIYNVCYDWLKEKREKKLMFIGTGCQAAGFNKFCVLKGIRDRVLIVDIVCHGVSSPRLWKEYIEGIEKKVNSDLRFVSFKDKRNGWKRPYAFVKFNKEVSLEKYVRTYYSAFSMRPSCYFCRYSSPVRNTDITIGDYWGIEKINDSIAYEKGVSLILAHSQKGLAFIRRINRDMLIISSEIKDCLQPNLINPTKKPVDREKFWNFYKKNGAIKTVNKYGNKNLFKRLINKIRRLVY